jgi:NAD(P)-dependent dehydrogenase (short-subunit alcohol dehydrogenase family)
MAQTPGTLIVTGGSRGIGAAVCRLAAHEGYAVAVNFHSQETAANAVVQEIRQVGGRVTAIRADIGKEADVLRLFEQAEEQLGALGALVNNAAITGGFARVQVVDARMLERLFAVNVTGAMLCAREAVKRLSTACGGRGGAIVNISSRAAKLGSAGEWVHYAMSKGAIDSLTVGLAREVAGEGIRVNAVAPGHVLTDIHKEAGDPQRPVRMAPAIPMGRPGTPEEIAAGVIWLLSPAASYVTGTILEIGGGR